VTAGLFTGAADNYEGGYTMRAIKLALLLSVAVTSGAVLAQNTSPAAKPATSKPAQTSAGGQTAGAQAAGAAADAGAAGGAGLAGMGIPGAIAAGVVAVGAASTNENTTPPKH
jgi:hypothetical protein